MTQSKSIKVEALKDHTFAGESYASGATYAVKGDGFQTAEQYVETLKATGLAKLVGEVTAANVDDAPADAPEAAKDGSAVKPLTTKDMKPETILKANKPKARAARRGKK